MKNDSISRAGGERVLVVISACDLTSLTEYNIAALFRYNLI